MVGEIICSTREEFLADGSLKILLSHHHPHWWAFIGEEGRKTR